VTAARGFVVAGQEPQNEAGHQCRSFHRGHSSRRVCWLAMTAPLPAPDPVRPGAKPPDVPRRRFRRGRRYPRAIAWLGFRSFWGHLWPLAASVVATADIDARD